MINKRRLINTPAMSFNEKYSWKISLSDLDMRPKGFLEPVWCNRVIWIITMARIINGMMKWNVKNRIMVGLSTETPPQIN